MPISSMNQPLAIAHILRETRSTLLVASKDQSAQQSIKSALSTMAKEEKVLQVTDMPTFDELFRDGPEMQLVEASSTFHDRPTIYVHSSGKPADAST